jgi:hypothetical protein
MTEQIRNILDLPTTKTEKIKQLLQLGTLTRQEIAALVTNGNVGFVYNVYKQYFRDAAQQVAAVIFTPSTFARRFGVEIEATNVNKNVLLIALRDAGIKAENDGYSHNTTPHWKIVSDSSISGTDTFELVSPILEGTNGINEVDIVCQVLEQLDAKVNKSCGLHIHFDAANFDLATWKRIFKNYAKLEKTIDAFMPESRRASYNRYCRSLNSITNLESKLNSASDLSEIARIFSNDRYHKINPVSYLRHNTCEFRQHNGTIEFRKIARWIIFLNNLVDFSATTEVTQTNIDGLKVFNQPQIVEFYKHRTKQLAA